MTRRDVNTIRSFQNTWWLYLNTLEGVALVLQGGKECTDCLREAGIDVHSIRDSADNRLLHRAAQNGDAELVGHLIDQRADLEIRNIYGKTAFMSAVEYGKLSCVKTLVKAGVNVNPKANNGNTALHVAARNGYEEVVAYYFLINKRVDIMIKNPDGDTPLMSAVREGRLECVIQLVEAGCSVSTKRCDSILLHLAIRYARQRIIAYLIDQGVDIMAKNGDGETPFMSAFNKEHLGCVMQLLKAAVERNDKNALDQITVELNHLVIQRRASANVSVLRVIEEIIQQGNILFIQSLTAAGFSWKDFRNNRNDTALHIAARSGHAEVVAYLISQHADLKKAFNDDGETPLIEAIGSNSERCVIQLIRAGANPNVRDKIHRYTIV